MSDCPSDDDLSSFLDECLPEVKRDHLSAHVDGCQICQVRLDRLTHVTEVDAARYLEVSGIRPGVSDSHNTSIIPDSLPVDATAVARLDVRPHRPRPIPSVPGFDVLQEIGQGGMGVVYRARHRRLNRPVALKMILAGVHADPRTVQRFFFEAEVMARIRHPQVVEVFEANVYQGPDGIPVPYLAMELLEGGTLRNQMKSGTRTPVEAAALIEGIARAVHAAHLQGVVHRDLKPGNILFRAESPTSPPSAAVSKVCDFGLAKLIAPTDGDLTATGQVIGTPAYMAPEQASGDLPAGPATDIYALGTILFELLIGHPPFHGREPMNVLARVIREPAPAVHRLRPDVPRDLAAVTMKCLEKEPNRRYQSAEELADDLHRFLTHRPTIARPAGPPERAWRWARRNPAVAGLLASLAAVLVVGLVSVFGLWQRAERIAADERQSKETAIAAEQRAEDSLRLADAREARLEFDRGLALCEDGEVERGLRHFVRSLKLAEETRSEDLARVTRTHLAAWPAKLTTRLRTFAPGSATKAVAFSADGKNLLTGGANGRLVLWETDTGRTVREYRTGKSPDKPGAPLPTFWSVAVSPDGKRVVGGADDGQLWVWKTEAEEPLAAIPVAVNAGGVVSAAAFAPDGSVWIADGRKGASRWNLESGKLVGEASGRIMRSAVKTLALGADGTRLFLGDSSGFLHQWDVAAEKIQRGWASQDSIGAIGLSPDESTLAATGPGGTCRVIDLKTSRIDHTISLLGTTGNAVGFSLAGDLVLVGDSDGNVRTLDRATGQPAGVPLPCSGELTAIRTRPGTNEFAVASWDGVRLCRPTEAGWQAFATNEGRVRALQFDATGKRLAIASGRQVAIHDSASRRKTHAYALNDEPLTVCFDPFRPRLLCGGRESVLLVPFDDVPKRLPGSEAYAPYSAITFVGNGAQILAAGQTGLHRWDSASFASESKRASQLAQSNDIVLDARPGGGEVLMGSANRVAFLDPQTLAPARPGWTLPDQVTAACYSADGSRVLVGLRDNSALWMDAATGVSLTPPMTQGRSVTAVAISLDGKVLLTGSRDGTACYWDSRSGLPLGPLMRHAGPVTAVAFSPSGEYSATGTSNGHALRWPAPASPVREPLEILQQKLAPVARD